MLDGIFPLMQAPFSVCMWNLLRSLAYIAARNLPGHEHLPRLSIQVAKISICVLTQEWVLVWDTIML